MAEIYAQEPVAATINSEPIVNYRGGVYTDNGDDTGTNHIVSIVGWGTTATAADTTHGTIDDRDDYGKTRVAKGKEEKTFEGGKNKNRKNKDHLIICNSWGQYWGEMGYIRVEMGKNVLGLESDISWATLGSWTEDTYKYDTNRENFNNVRGGISVNPSEDVEAVKRRLREEM